MPTQEFSKNVYGSFTVNIKISGRPNPDVNAISEFSSEEIFQCYKMSFKISVSAEIRLEIPYELMILAKLTWNRVALIF